jgi:hypothetical protein
VKGSARVCLLFIAAACAGFACDSKPDAVTKGRETVKEAVTQPFNALESAKESLGSSEDKTKAAIEELDRDSKQP